MGSKDNVDLPPEPHGRPLGWRVLAVDLDPQANLTSAFFDEDKLELFWEPESTDTVFSAVAPLIRHTGDVQLPEPRGAAERLWVIPGDLGLSSFEDRLSDAWRRSFLSDEGAIRVTTAFHRTIRGCAAQVQADVVFLDVGPTIDAPRGSMEPIGFVVLQHAVRLDRPVKAYDRWLRRIPGEFHRSVLGQEVSSVSSSDDPYQLASLRSYRSLMPLAQDARKPMFELRPGDGALGSTGRLVQTCFREFESLALQVMRSAAIALPVPS